MIKDFYYQNYHAFICDMSHYDELIEIGKSRPDVHGSLKTVAWYDIFNLKLKHIIQSTSDKLFVVAVKNTSTNQIMSYMITAIPYEESCFMFFIFGETRRTDSIFTLDTSLYGVWKLSLLNGYAKGIFDAFFSIRANGYRTLVRNLKKCDFLDSNGITYNWQLNDILMPDQSSKNAIQKLLVFDNPNMIKREHPIAICHASLKPEFRIKYFSNYFEEKIELVANDSIQS
jgi:hypothetical protein